MGTVWPVYEHKYCYDNFYFWHYVEEACAKNLFHRCPTFNVADESMTGHINFSEFVQNVGVNTVQDVHILGVQRRVKLEALVLGSAEWQILQIS